MVAGSAPAASKAQARYDRKECHEYFLRSCSSRRSNITKPWAEWLATHNLARLLERVAWHAGLLGTNGFARNAGSAHCSLTLLGTCLQHGTFAGLARSLITLCFARWLYLLDTVARRDGLAR